MNRVIRWDQIKHHWEIYLFIVPTVVLVVLFQYYPAASGIFHSFYRWNGADISEFVGFKNYTDILTSSDFWKSFHIAIILGLWNVVKLAPPLIAAVWIHRCRSERVQFIYRLLFIVPMVTPGLVIVLIWHSFFFESTQGYLNQFLNDTGLITVLCRLDTFFGWGGVFVEGVNPAWLGDPRLVLVACVIWGFPWVGSFTVLTFLAKLQTISKEIYEAGSIDGVNWWTRFSRIELPLITGSIYLMLVFVIIGTIKDAGSLLLLVGVEGGPGGNATVPALFMLRKAFINQEMGAACAIGVVLTLVVFALQKITALLMEEEGGRRNLRRFLRPAGMAGGGAMLFMPSFSSLGILLLATVFPYDSFAGASRHVAGRLLARCGIRRGPRVLPPPRRPLHPAIERGIDVVLRASKHVGLWLIILAAFLPVYLIAIVSGKTNQQFYEAPGHLTHPFLWGNWAVAWHLVSPSVANSIFISVSSTFLTLLFSLGGAYFFARYRVPFHGLLWNALLILIMMPSVANLIPLFRLLSDMNLLNTLSALILVGASGGQAFAIFVLRNFVADIPHDLFEAAEIDGANHFQQMWNVVLPLCGPILGTIGVMHFISEWSDFLLPLIVMRDSDKLPVMVQLQRLSGEYIKNFGPLMAGYAIVSIPVILLFAFSMRLFVRGATDGAVKG